VYAGLAGALLALIVAAATNGWSIRVFALLALRLAIGWHFLFEGLHKVHSTYVGPTETNRPFSSEMYFVAAEGPIGEMMRKQWIGDPDAEIAARITPQKDKIEGFDKLSDADQAALCPKPVADKLTAECDLNAAKAKRDELKTAAKEADDAAKTAPADKAEELKKKAADAQKKAAAAESKVASMETTPDLISNGGEKLKAMYARWVYGAVQRDAKVKFVSTDVPMAVPARLEIIEMVRKEYEANQAQERAGLGQGYGIDHKRAAGLRADLTTAKADLVKDADTFQDELVQLTGGSLEPPKEKKIALLDRLTRWGITAIGAGLLIGLFTRLWCVAGAGFLVLTYLSHPTVPWLPLPPMTEGNPLFINKNLIEALALLAIATFPTGRWLGLDALVYRIFCRPKSAAATAGKA
jgi:uncharacterized membrane protein YphA (DoxX/SURF4 family)